MSRVDNVWNNYDLYVMLQLNGETTDIILKPLKFSDLLTKVVRNILLSLKYVGLPVTDSCYL